MLKRLTETGLVVFAVTLPLVAGCGGGGGGLSSLFGGGSDVGEVIGSLSSSGGSGGDAVQSFASSGPIDSSGSIDTASVQQTAGVLHNPEPASMALFGGGLMGLGLLRRRRSRKQAS